jgi:phosphatidylserine decarboxylase
MKPKSEVYLDLTRLFLGAAQPELSRMAEKTGLMWCPGKGVIDRLGDIQAMRIPQAEGQSYALTELLGHSAERAQPFMNGHFVSIRLTPDDDLRVYMPISGRLIEMLYIPGYSGGSCSRAMDSSESAPRLPARNHEQVACIFQTEAGPLAVIMVGAACAGSIETVWTGKMKPLHDKGKKVTNYNFRDVIIELNQGQEIAHFNTGGSTLLVLFGPSDVRWRSGLGAGMWVEARESLGQIY